MRSRRGPDDLLSVLGALPTHLVLSFAEDRRSASDKSGPSQSRFLLEPKSLPARSNLAVSISLRRLARVNSLLPLVLCFWVLRRDNDGVLGHDILGCEAPERDEELSGDRDDADATHTFAVISEALTEPLAERTLRLEP